MKPPAVCEVECIKMLGLRLKRLRGDGHRLTSRAAQAEPAGGNNDGSGYCRSIDYRAGGRRRGPGGAGVSRNHCRWSGIAREARRPTRDFDEFADVLNSWLSRDQNSAPWRVQELPETELTLTPSGFFGR